MDTRDINAQNLLFLLSAAPLSIGCVITTSDDVATSDPTSTTNNNTTTTGDTDPTTDTPGTTEATSMGTTVGAEDTTVGAEETTAGTTEGETSETGGAPRQCIDYGDTVTYCYDDKSGQAALESCAEYYYQLYDMYGDACALAFGDYIACLSTLTCKEFEDPAACPDEDEAFQTACFG